jgi:four helix bundle protein
MKDEGRKKPEDLRARTKAFALRIVRLFVALPKRPEAHVIGKQMLRAGTSVGAHYRESLRARSDAEVISKLEGGLQELEETRYWLELLAESGIVEAELLTALMDESDQLIAILVTCVKRVKERRL